MKSDGAVGGPLRVLLISANTEKLPDPVFPIGAAYGATAAVRQGHSVDTLDLCFAEALRRLLDERLRAVEPHVVGISLRNLDSSAFPQNTSDVDDYKRLVDTVRAHSNWIVPGKGIKTNIQVLQQLRERKIKGQLWRRLR